MNRSRKWIIYAVLAGIILVWTALSGDKDYYYREFGQNGLTRFHNDSLSADEASEYDGILAETPSVSLPAGSYTIIMNYETDTDDNTFYIYTDDSYFSNMEGVLLSAPSCREVQIQLEEDGKNLTVCLYYNGTGSLNIKNVVIQSDGPVCTDRFFICGAALILLGIWVYLDWKESSARKTYLWLLSLGLLATIPFINGYLIKGQDMSFHLNRIEEICAGLQDGQFPVRIQPDTLNGYGYAAPLMYPELFLYLPALLRAAGVSMVTAVGLFMLLVNMATGAIMYFCAGRMFSSRFTALVCSLLYALAIYRLINCYTRFALGELLAMTFMPLLVYGLYEVLKGNPDRWPWLTAGICGVLQSHVISTLFAVMITFLFCLIFIRKVFEKSRFFALMKSGLWSVILNLWFLVPFLHMFREELNTGSMQLQFEKIALSFVQIFQVFSRAQGDTSFVGESLNGKMSLCLGIALIFFSACCLYGIAVKAWRRERTMPCVCLGLGIFFVLMTTQWFPWDILFRVPLFEKGISFIQFPWRFLSCAAVFLTFSAGAGAEWLKEQCGSPCSVLAAALILAILPACYYMDDFARGDIYLMKEELPDRDDIAGGEYLYTGTDVAWLKDREAVPLSDDPDFSVTDFQKQGTSMVMEYRLDGTESSGAVVEMPVLYYPGYIAVWEGEGENQQLLEISRGKNQLAELSVPAGEGVIVMKYQGLTAWRMGFYISLIGLALFCGSLWMERKHIAAVSKQSM